MFKQLLPLALLASTQAVVIPFVPNQNDPSLNVLVTSEGFSQDANVFSPDPFTACVLYSATLNAITTFPSNTVINAIGVRLDDSDTEPRPTNGSITFNDYVIGMGTSTIEPKGFPKNFSLLTGGKDFAIVRKGPLEITKGYLIRDSSGRGDSNTFVDFPLDRGYGYNSGNFVFYATHTGFNEPGDQETDINIDFEITTANKFALGANFGFQTPQAGQISSQAIILELTVTTAPSFSCTGVETEGSPTAGCYVTSSECLNDDDDDNNNDGNEPIEIVTIADDTNGDGDLSFDEVFNACRDRAPLANVARCRFEGSPCTDFDGGEVVGDPHFIGFDGSRYNFKGVKGQSYNIISDVNFQLNAEMDEFEVKGVEGTWMSKLGFIIADTTIVYNKEGALINGEQLITSTNNEQVAEGVTISVAEGNGMTISTYGYSVLVRVMNKEDKPYLDIKVSIKHAPINIHGVLGQTYNNVINNVNNNVQASHVTIIEGLEEDYLVKEGIVGIEFRFNRYSSAFIKNKKRASTPVEFSANSIGFEA